MRDLFHVFKYRGVVKASPCCHRIVKIFREVFRSDSEGYFRLLQLRKRH